MTPRLSFTFMQHYSNSMRAGKSVPRLSRTVPMQASYEAHKQKHPDLHNYIMAHYLADCDSSLVRNKFPLPLEPNVSQYVLWLKTPRSFEDVERLVQVAFAPKRIALYENPHDWKSIPTLSHFHIFVEDYKPRL